MALLIACENKDYKPWLQALLALAPDLDIRIWPDSGDPRQITFALTWRHPHGLLREFPNLRSVSSMGAGIDHILADNNFPEHLAVARLVDPYLVDDMFDYLTAQVSGFRHHHQLYFQCQLQQQWQPLTPLSRKALVIGVMGLGQIGGQVAKRFAEAGYSVVGWSNSAKSINGVKSFTGPGALENFLAETNLLINLLPLTKETQGILSAKNLIKLKPGAFLINVGRGGHLVEADLVALLDNRHLSGACLDVFEQEPLPLNHPFWSHPNIMITPHVSSLTNPESVAPQILKNYRRSEKGETLINQVDLKRGY